MSFFDRVVTFKTELHFQEMKPVVSSDGFKEVRFVDGSLNYTHKWEYFYQGCCVKGVEEISCSNSTHSGEQWRLAYKGKICDKNIQNDRERIHQIYSYRDGQLNISPYSKDTEEIMRSSPRIPGSYNGDAILDNSLSMKIQTEGWARQFNGTERIFINGKQVFKLFFGGGIK